MSNQKYIKSMLGFKATNTDMTCRGHKFELGVWAEAEGDLVMCQNGFHFCVHPSGVYSYYNTTNVRVFKCEAEEILEVPTEAGADFKLVARRIRLTEEITPGLHGNDKSNTGHSNTGHRNTGDWNTGDSNTGDSNTGHWNTGHRNTGDSNTGDWNTGDSNTGDSNTGHRNTGDWNTGHRNTGHRNTGDSNTGHSNTGDSNTGHSNTGHRNTGDWNTGHRNTGDSNTGNWNTTNFSSGMFCAKEPRVISFDVQTKLTREKYLEKYPEAHALGEALIGMEPIKFDNFKRIPGITKDKLAALHAAHLAAKKK